MRNDSERDSLTRTGSTFVLAIVGVAQGATGEGSCSPLSQPVVEDTASDVTLEAGRLEDDQVSLDWRLYGAWENGACLDLKFTNLGARITNWRFDMTFDKVIETVSYPGPSPASLSVVLDQARLVPFSEPIIQPFGTVSYPVCFEPIARPSRFVATVVRDDTNGSGSGSGVGLDSQYGWVFDDSRAVMLSWLAENKDTGETCLDLRVSNLRDDVAVLDWSLRVQFDQGFTLTDVDTAFFYFPANLDQLDITPTATNVRIDPLDIATGTICLSTPALPTTLAASFRTVPAEPAP